MNRSIATIVCLTAAIILAIALVFPKKGDLDSSNKKVSEKKAELQSKEEYFASLAKTSRELERYPSQLAKIGSALPASSQLPALFEFLQKAASQTGLVLTSISPLSLGQAAESRGGLADSAINLQVAGSYPAFRDFLSVLENSSRLIEIENIAVSVREAGSEFGLRIKAYSH